MENEQRDQIKEMIRDILAEQRAERLLSSERFKQESEDRKVERLYLLTFARYIFIPDAKGRAIGTETVYARVKLDGDTPSFFGGSVAVCAFGDGRLLETPLTVLLTGNSAVSMVEVPDSVLAGMKPE